MEHLILITTEGGLKETVINSDPKLSEETFMLDTAKLNELRVDGWRLISECPIHVGGIPLMYKYIFEHVDNDKVAGELKKVELNQEPPFERPEPLPSDSYSDW